MSIIFHWMAVHQVNYPFHVSSSLNPWSNPYTSKLIVQAERQLRIASSYIAIAPLPSALSSPHLFGAHNYSRSRSYSSSNYTMPGEKISSTDDERRLSLAVEREELLGYGDGGNDDGIEESEQWPGKNVSFGQTYRKCVPRPSTLRGWILLALLVMTAWSLGGAMGYLSNRALNQACTVLECVKMTSSYCA